MPRNANQSKSSNYSLDFDGSSDISISGISVAGEFTLSAWVKGITSSTFYIFGSTNTSNWFRIQGGNAVNLKVGNGQLNDSLPNTIPTFTFNSTDWFHIVATRDSSNNIQVYVNGSVDSNYTPRNTATPVGANFVPNFIGQNYNQYTTGKLDAVSIFDYALSASQVTTLYGDSTNGPGNPMALPSPPVAYYPLGASAWNGNFLAENNAIGDYVFDFTADNILFNTLNLGTQSTESFWVKRTTSNSNLWLGRLGPSGSSQGGYPLYLEPSTIYTRITTAGGSKSISFSTPNDTWMHICRVRNGNNVSVYVSYYGTFNQNSGTNNFTAFTGLENEDTIISEFTGNVGNTFEASNWQFFNTALSVTDVETLYNYGSPIRTLANIPQNSNLKAWYKLDASEIYNSSSTEWRIANNPYNYSTALKMWTNSWNTTPVNQTYHVANGNPRTVSAWIQIPPSKTYNACLAQAGDGTSRYNCVFWGQNFGGLSLFTPVVGNNSSDRFLYFGLNSSNIVRDHWYHIAFTDTGVDGVGRFKTYLNGEFKNQSTLNYDYGTYINGFRWAGTTNDNVLANWSGLILAHGRMYDAVLTASEIQTLYNNGTPQNINNVKPSNLKQWIAFDDQLPTVSPWTLPDLSGNNNTANLSYAPFFTSILDPINTKNGLSSGMSQTNLVQSDLQTVASYSKYAMNFDVSDYIDLTSQIVLASELTISCWVKSDGAVVYGITAGNNGSADSWYRFYPTHSGGNRVDIMIDGTSTEWNFANGGTPIQNGVWQHYLLKRDSSNKWTFYLDNVKYTTNQPTISGSFRVDTFCRIYSTSPRYFDGVMSNMAIWNTSLSDSQVREVYNQGLPSDLNSFSGTAPIHWWQLGEGSSYESGWIFADEIGSINGEGQNIAETDLTNGVGTTANGTSNNMVVGDLVSDAPYSTGNAMSVNMAATARGTNVP